MVGLLFLSTACHNEYWMSQAEFARLASGPSPPSESGEDIPRVLRVPADEAVPALRVPTSEKALVCAGKLKLNAARLRSNEEGNVWVPAFEPHKLLAPGAVFIGLGAPLLALGISFIAIPQVKGVDGVSQFSGGLIGLVFGGHLLPLGLGLTISGVRQKRPESCPSH